MSGRINSQPLGVKTVYDSLDVKFDITVTGANSGIGTAQWYYASRQLAPGETDNDRYSPNRHGQGGEPITLHPVVTAIDPETHNYVTAVMQGCSWTEIAENGTRTSITNTTDGANVDYVVKPDGSLLVKKNVPYNAQVSLECVYTWTDPRNADWHRDSATIDLKTNLAADEIWKVTIAKRSQKFNPLSGMSSVFTVTAKAMEGNTDRSSEVTFKWKYLHNTGTAQSPTWVEKDVDDADYPCLAYFAASQTVSGVSKGQGTDTIVLDMEYESETLGLVCYIYKGSPLTIIDNAQEYASIAWQLPQAEGMAFCPNGDTARQTIPTMTFKTVVHAGGDQVADSVLRNRTRTHWYSKRDKPLNGAAPTKIDRGWGFDMTMQNTDLLTADNARVVVTPEIHVLSPYRIMTQAIGGTKKYLYYMDGSTKKYIVGKVMD